MKKNYLAAVLALGLSVTGGGSASAQTDVTSKYLTNADFEGTYSVFKKVNNDGRSVFQPDGWTATYSNGDGNDMTVLKSGDPSYETFKDVPKLETGGNQTYLMRFRWGNKEVLSLSQDTKVLPIGKYTISADVFFTTTTATATLSAGGVTETIQNSGSDKSKGKWTKVSFDFTLTEAKVVTIKYTLTQKKQEETVGGLDNIKLEFNATKAGLQSVIAQASSVNSLLKDANLSSAITSAQTVYGNESATQEELDNGYSALNKSLTTAQEKLSSNGYYIQNANSGLYLGGANAWGTQASVVNEGQQFKLTLADGAYSIQDLSIGNSNSNYLGTDLYVDKASNDKLKTNWSIIPVEGADNEFTISYVDNGTTYYVAQSATTGAYSGNITEKVTSVTDASKWYFLTKEQAIAQLSNATEEKPLTATFLIGDADFSRNHASTPWSMTASNKNLSGGKDANCCAESYHSTFTLTQTIDGVPNGKYKLSAQGFYRQDGKDNNNLPYFFLNDTKVTFPVMTGKENNMGDASASFTTGSYKVETDYVVVTDGKITLGAKNESNTSLWCIWDNFDLTYYGAASEDEALANAKKDYDAAISTAKSVLADETTYKNVKGGKEESDLQTAVAANEPATVDGYKTATSNLNDLTTAFTAAKVSYDAFATASTAETTDLPYAAEAKKQAVVDAKAVAKPTTAADAKAKADAITTALRAYYEDNSIGGKYVGTDGYKDYTSSIKNADASDGTNNWNLAQSDGGSSISSKNDQSYTDANGDSNHSYFDGGNWNKNDWTTKFQQTITGLVPGKYLLAVTSRGSEKLQFFQLFANDNKIDLPHTGGNVGTGVFDKGWTDNVLPFTTDGSDVTIGVTANNNPNNNVNHQWQSFTRFRLVKIGDLDNVALDENATTAPDFTKKEPVNVTLTRTFNSNAWNTLVVPFDMTAEQVTATFGKDTKVAKFTGTTENEADGTYTLNFETTTSIKANEPVFIYGAKTSVNDVVKGVTIKSVEGDPKVEPANAAFSFVGTYVTKTVTPGSWFINSENKLYRAGDDKTQIKALRAEFRPTTEAAAAKGLTISFDGGETTGISSVKSEESGVKNSSVYTLSGQKVAERLDGSKLPAGLYIVGGKKVIVK